MVWKELTFGFLVAGAVAALVPASFFRAIFPAGLTALLLVPIHALLGPVLAVLDGRARYCHMKTNSPRRRGL